MSLTRGQSPVGATSDMTSRRRAAIGFASKRLPSRPPCSKIAGTPALLSTPPKLVITTRVSQRCLTNCMNATQSASRRHSGRVFRQTTLLRPFRLSLVSVACALVFSIGPVGLSVLPTARAAGPTDRPAPTTPTVALRPGQRGARSATRAVDPSNDTRLSAKPAQPAPSPPPEGYQSTDTPDIGSPSPADATDGDPPAAAPLTSELTALQAKIRRVLAIYFPKHQNTPRQQRLGSDARDHRLRRRRTTVSRGAARAEGQRHRLALLQRELQG